MTPEDATWLWHTFVYILAVLVALSIIGAFQGPGRS